MPSYQLQFPMIASHTNPSKFVLVPSVWNQLKIREIYMGHYYMALSHKDWELPNSRIWLAELDIDCGVDFPI